MKRNDISTRTAFRLRIRVESAQSLPSNARDRLSRESFQAMQKDKLGAVEVLHVNPSHASLS